VIAVVFGTTGELIKLAPVLVRMRRRGHSVLLLTTAQQVQQIPIFLDQFGLQHPDLWLGRGARGRDLATNRDVPGWLAEVTRTSIRNRKWVRHALVRGPGRPLVLVHGDTMTTVLGAVLGRVLEAPVAHIEAGLRSHDLLNPFPEEINRRLASAIAQIHYAPGSWAASNLRRGVVVDIGSNTIRDSLALVPSDFDGAFQPPGERFGLVSLHRFELLRSRQLLAETLQALAEAADHTPLLFVDHPVTVAAIERFGFGTYFDAAQFRRVPRLPFFDFVQLQRRCAFVVTDSGGSQEECYFLDRPCLVHRKRTERREGLDENVVLSGLEPDVLRDFLREPSRFFRANSLPEISPSDIVVDDLERRGFAAGPSQG
jgi:UDP-N-acetylglucosamine 2-epimerase (non-hydrolysing)